jgi:hypothetical protein
MVEEMQREIVEKISATRVITRPFPYIVVNDALPMRLRRAIDHAWPTPDMVFETNFARRKERTVGRLAAEMVKLGRSDLGNVWKVVHAVTREAGTAIREKLKRYRSDKYRPILGPDWRRRLKDAHYETFNAQVAENRGQIELDPHVDNVRVEINGFIYLDDPDQPTPEPRRGTTVFRSNGFAWPSNLAIPMRLREHFLREEAEIGWKDNRLFAYVNGPWSFHGVPAHDLGDARRRLLMLGTLLTEETVARVFETE